MLVISSQPKPCLFPESCNPLVSEWSYRFVESFFFPWNSAFSPKFNPRSGPPKHCFLTYDPFLSEKILSDNGYIGIEDRCVRQAWENGSAVACWLSKCEDLSSNHQDPCTDRHGSICLYPQCSYYETRGEMGRSQEPGASQPGASGSKHGTLSVWNKAGDENWHSRISSDLSTCATCSEYALKTHTYTHTPFAHIKKLKINFQKR